MFGVWQSVLFQNSERETPWVVGRHDCSRRSYHGICMSQWQELAFSPESEVEFTWVFNFRFSNVIDDLKSCCCRTALQFWRFGSFFLSLINSCEAEAGPFSGFLGDFLMALKSSAQHDEARAFESVPEHRPVCTIHRWFPHFLFEKSVEGRRVYRYIINK